MSLKKFLIGFGIIAIVLTLIPFIAVDYWWIRVFDFPHLQLTFLTSIAITVYIIRFDFKNYKDYIFIAVLIICFIYQFAKIFPYTAFADYEVLEATSSHNKLSILTANVLQKNKESQKLKDEIDSLDADLLLFTEVNKRWQNDIREYVSKKYPFAKEYPLDNTYGMVFYSKLKLVEPKINFLVSDSIPSIHSKVILKSGDTIQIYAIHPTPPMPKENPRSTNRDAEMMKIAKLSLDSKIPVLVFGDFNDVAWSVTSKLFERVSMLLDIRVGRGLYCTYNAKNPIMRWPLDHVFISEEFRHIRSKTGNEINSDHFPFYVELSFEPNLSEQQREPYPSDQDLKDALDQMTSQDLKE